jgi:hypothetical protein
MPSTPPDKVNKYHHSNRARSIGLVVAILVHVGILSVMMLSSASTLNVAGLEGTSNDLALGEATAIDVTLRPEVMPSSQPAGAKPLSPFERFRPLIDVDSDLIKPEPLNKTQPSKSLAEALGEDVFKPKLVPLGAKEGMAAKTNAAEAHIKVNGQNTKSLNDLWKAIEPCWRRNATKDTQGVTLVISFSPHGNLSKPPLIDRPRGANLDAGRLRSEAQAINALSQCGPYLMAFGQENVSVSFPGGK